RTGSSHPCGADRRCRPGEAAASTERSWPSGPVWPLNTATSTCRSMPPTTAAPSWNTWASPPSPPRPPTSGRRRPDRCGFPCRWPVQVTLPNSERVSALALSNNPALGRLEGGQGFGDVGFGGRLADAGFGEYALAVFVFQQCEQDVLGPDEVVAQPQGLAEGELQRLFGLCVKGDEVWYLVG